MAKITTTKQITLVMLEFFSLVVLASFSVFGQAIDEPAKIEYYQSDNITNQIPFFDNRFRIDAQLEEINLVFYRKSGSRPVILVKPDGSKIRVNNFPKAEVEWYDDKTFDLIKIKKPMPGPWQAIGEIIPGSQILVVSEISLSVEPLPEILLVGETIKVAAKLLNGGHALEDHSFRDVVNLNVEFFSTNNSAYENFGAEPIQLTTFRDDGQELDEYAKDGVFTGEFELDFAPGEWVPLYSVITPMVTRELRLQPVIVQPTPISFSVDATKDKNSAHIVHFIIDPTHVDPDSVVFQGKITHPDRQVEAFSIMDGSGTERIKEVAYTEGGVHRVQVSVFGKTTKGREFRLVVPEFAFNAERSEDTLPSSIGAEGENTITPKLTAIEIAHQRQVALLLEIEQQKTLKTAEEQEQQKNMMITIAFGNLVIIIIGIIVYFGQRFRQSKKSKVNTST